MEESKIFFNIYPYIMIILLTSENYTKLKLVKKWIKKNNLDDVSFLKFNKKDTLLPIQPINSGAKLSCNESVNNMEEKESRCYDIIMSFEECIDIENNEILFYFYVVCKNILTNEKIEGKSKHIIIDYNILEKYPNFTNIVKDLYNNYIDTKCKYIYDGCELTLSKLISNNHSNLDEDNWTEKLKYIKKEDILLDTFDKINLVSLLS